MRVVKLCIAILFRVILWTDAGLRGLARLRIPPTFVVLMYHSVKEAERRRFARQMDLLAATASPVPADFAGTGQVGSGCTCVAVTFDDGYRSVVENAVPTLIEKHIPATLFVPTRYLGDAPAWIDDETSRDKDETLVSVEELKALRKEGFLIGAHGAAHRPLAALSPAEALDELTESRRELQRILGEEIRMFALPYGSSSPEVLDLAMRAGYDRVFLGDPLGSRENVAGHVAGRIGVTPGDWLLEYRLKLRGAYRWLPLAIAVKGRTLDLLRGAQSTLGRARHRLGRLTEVTKRSV